MYETYKLSPSGFKAVSNKIIRNLSILIVSVLLIVALGMYYGQPNQPNILQTIGIFVFATMVFRFWAIYRVIKRTRAMLESYCFTITDQWVQREQQNASAMRIHLEDIEFITQHTGGGFTIKGKGKYDYIVISKYAEPYAQLEKSLQQIRPFSDFSPALSFFDKFKIALSLLVAGLGLVVFLADNKWLVAICGTLLIGYFSWYLFEQKQIRSAGHLGQKYRTSYVVLLVLVVLFMLIKLSG